MAAILPYLETEPEQLSMALGDARSLRKLTPESPMSKRHTELSKLAWARSLIAKSLEGRAFSVEDDNGVLFVRVSPGIPTDVVPWHKSGSEALNRFQLFSTNSKMRCPTFDLPSGVWALGGSCPAARWGQSTVEPEARDLSTPAARFAARVVGHRLDLNSAVCGYCYASGGKYGEVSVQFAEAARFAFVRSMMATPAGTEKLKQLLSWAVNHTLHWKATKYDASMRHGLKPVRVHSSGDFFSLEYAELWMDVARRVAEFDPAVRFWAPTRTHVLKKFSDFWATPGRVPPNFIIRPSAYHIGDAAPRAAGLARGTSVLDEGSTAAQLRKGDGRQRGDGSIFDWQCGVYALKKGNKTCASARAPDGKVGCRACWKNPELAVSYTAH